jgi:hypothetical protein
MVWVSAYVSLSSAPIAHEVVFVYSRVYAECVAETVWRSPLCLRERCAFVCTRHPVLHHPLPPVITPP